MLVGHARIAQPDESMDRTSANLDRLANRVTSFIANIAAIRDDEARVKTTHSATNEGRQPIGRDEASATAPREKLAKSSVEDSDDDAFERGQAAASKRFTPDAVMAEHRRAFRRREGKKKKSSQSSPNNPFPFSSSKKNLKRLRQQR